MEERVMKRSEIPVEMTWNLKDIYEDENAWQADLDKALDLAKELAAREGHAAASAQELLKSMKLYEECMRRASSASGYASMVQDQDTADAEGQRMVQTAQKTGVHIDELTAFLFPELLKQDQAVIEGYFSMEPQLEEYRVTISEVFRTKEHTLSSEMEALIASAGEVAATPYNAFSMLVDADLKFPSVADGKGEMHALSNGRFVPMEMSHDRVLRKNAFEAFYSRYKEFAHTWAALYDGQVKQQIFSARAHKYPSTFLAATEGMNNVSGAVCDNLIASVREHLDVMHRYVRLRKKLLGVEELHMYDVYAPMVSDYEYHVTFEEAKAITLEALKPMGEEYLSVVRKAYAERWIDVPENEGKRGGAYSTDAYLVHPYMLLNFHGTLDDIFTLIHEMGHSLHTWYSTHNQNFLNSRYSMFVAEVASETNEILLLEYLLGKAEDPKEKAYLINHYLEFFKSTMIRQTMFGEYERRTNQLGEEGVPLTAEVLSDVYYQLNKDYFGPDMVSDPLIASEWCRIPHFYYDFYVYQYATSFAAAVATGHRILAEGQPMVDKYLKFLSAGCTTDPVSILKIAGVDLSTRQPMDEALQIFDQVIGRMEELCEK